LSFAAFFFLTGRGPYAIDRLLFPTREPSPDLARRAMVYLRVATGLGLAVVAFTEKLADPALAQAFLQRYPLNARRGGAAPLGARSPRRPPRTGLESRSAATSRRRSAPIRRRHGMSVALRRSTMTATDAPGAAAEEA